MGSAAWPAARRHFSARVAARCCGTLWPASGRSGLSPSDSSPHLASPGARTADSVSRVTKLGITATENFPRLRRPKSLPTYDRCGQERHVTPTAMCDIFPSRPNLVCKRSHSFPYRLADILGTGSYDIQKPITLILPLGRASCYVTVISLTFRTKITH